MKYMVIENTNTLSNAIAELDDLNRAIEYINMLTRDYTVVNNSDTDPHVVYYDITNKETAHNEGLDPEDVDYDPTGKIVWTSKKFYFEH